MLNYLLQALFVRVPDLSWIDEERSAYETLLARMQAGERLPDNLPWPKARFLQYLARKEEWLFHGSNNPDITVFTPREQTLYNGVKTKAVFASTEPMWSMFYAVLDRGKVKGGMRNACITNGREKFLFYSLNEATMAEEPWTSGMIYILPRTSFRLADPNKWHFDEWVSGEPVAPVARLALSPEDFPFLDRVAVHRDGESMLKSWLLYKRRCKQIVKAKKGAAVEG